MLDVVQPCTALLGVPLLVGNTEAVDVFQFVCNIQSDASRVKRLVFNSTAKLIKLINLTKKIWQDRERSR